jgi:cytochrome c-type biogenesis protein
MSLYPPGLAFAFTAGVFSIVSPCGYALLPGYISYYLGEEFSVARAVYGGLACTLGMMTMFSIVGGLASSIGALLPSLIPLFSLLAGFLLIFMGVFTLKDITLPLISIQAKPSRRRGLLGFYLFGVIYGLAGVGCSAPILLSVLFYALSRGFINGILTFITYALGMGVPLLLTSVLLAQAREYLISTISRITPKLHRFSGIILIIVGVYLIYFNYRTYLS